MKANQAYDEALVRGDAAALDRIYADEFVYTTPDGEVKSDQLASKDEIYKHFLDSPEFVMVLKHFLTHEYLAMLVANIFVIRMRADFEKWTSSNSKTEEYKEWVNYLFREIRTDLSDTKETSDNF